MGLLIISLPNITSLIISEVESNPNGKDSKNEWIELFSPVEIDGEYILTNNDASEIYDNEDENQLKIRFNFVGYYVYRLNSQWLDNSDEKVYLYDSDEKLIDSTNLFDDGEDSDNTWQRCDDGWVFEKHTPEVKNNCPEEEEEIEEEIEEEENEEIVDEEENSNSEEPSEEEIPDSEKPSQENTNSVTGSVIKLDSKDIKSKSNKENVGRSNLATTILGIVVILLLLLLVSQRYKQSKKNEFR